VAAQSDRPEGREQRPLVLMGQGRRNVSHTLERSRSKTPGGKPLPEPPGLAVRKTAARLLSAIVDAHTSLDALTDAEHGHPQFMALDGRDRALVRAILVTALRYHVTLGRMIDRHIARPLPANAKSLQHILHVAAAQILFLGVPDSAAVDLAVAHAKSDPRTVRFAALVNAVLRNVARGKDGLEATLTDTTDAPAWFAERLAEAYGAEKTAAILAMHRIEPPTDFSIRGEPERWAEKLGGIVLPTGSVRVARPDRSVPELPGFEEGAWWVQDAAASLPARLLGEVKGLRVADLCAAPGGKTAQLVLAGARVTAIDISESRVKRLNANLARLGLDAETVVSDLMIYKPEAPFDAVLLDAPCSSTGTVRRHPDVPWAKSAEDVTKLVKLQKKLLARAVDLVRPGGSIVFSNCSLDPSEGEFLVAEFLREQRDVRLDPISVSAVPGMAGFVDDAGMVRTTPADMVLGSPDISGLDGFFAVRLRRFNP
jgi:16S rRNA (cytosine967-C5)-methyltransferase